MVESYDPDELIACPFDPVHMVQRKRMPYHIVKCKKNFESSVTSNFKTCPFNERHIVPRSEYSYHLEHCENKGRLAVQIKSNDDDRPKVLLKGNTDTPVTDWKPPDSSEDWEKEYNAEQSTYAQESAYADEDNSPQPVPKPRLPYSTSHIESCSVLPRVRQLPNGLGRGRGRMASQTIGATPGIAANQTAQFESPRVLSEVQDRMSSTTSNAADHVESAQGTEEEEKQKQRRKLTKMLKQIEKIEEEQQQGRRLDEGQLSKLKRKDDVLHKLAQLQI